MEHRMKCWVIGGVIAFSLGLPSASPAQSPAPPPEPPRERLEDKSLEELMSLEVASVVGAARHEQRVTEAPSSVTIVTAADIRTFGWRTLADVLRSVRGFYTTNDRNYTYLGVRGFGRPTDYNNRVLVMVDGHRMNDNVYDAASIGTESIVDLDLVDRIEVIRGPGSALYGTSAFFGVINVVTRRGGAVSGVEASAEAGTLDTFGGRATFGRSWVDGRDLLVSVKANRSGGADELYFPEFDAPETSNGRAIGLDGDASGSVFLSGRTGNFTLQGVFGSRKKQIPTASWFTRFGDARFETTDRRGWIDVGYNRAVGQTEIAARGYVDRMDYYGIYPFDETETGINRDLARGSWIGGELGVSRRLGRHRLSVGFEQRISLQQRQANWDEGGETYVDDDHRSQQAAVFVQDEIALTRRLTATVGARLDWWSLGPGSVRPRAGLVYRTDEDMAVKLLYGEAFRAANVYELFYTEVGSQANPDLFPEVLRTTEAVFERYVGGRLRFTVAGFFTRIEDLIDQDGEGVVGHVNRGHVDARGIEAEVEYRSVSGVLARASAVAQRTRDRETSRALSNAPEQLATFQIAVPVVTRELTAALDGSVVGARMTRERRILDSFWLANAIVTWQPRGAHLLLQGGVYNLFDQRYEHPVGSEFIQDAITQNGRTAGAKIAVRF